MQQFFIVFPCSISETKWRAISKIVQKDIKDVYYALAKAYTVQKFNSPMKKLDVIDSKIKCYVQNIEYHKWSWSHCIANQTTLMTSNIVESVNSANIHARELLILYLPDFMTNMTRKWNYTNVTNSTYGKIQHQLTSMNPNWMMHKKKCKWCW